MKATIPIVCVLLLASCGSDSTNEFAAGEMEVIEADAPDLSGHYRILSLGEDPLGHSLEVSADVNSIWWEPDCSGQGLSYRATGKGEVEFFDPRDPDVPQIVCDIGFPEQLPLMWDALVGVHDIELRADRSLAITVDGEVWEFQPTTDPLPTDLTGTWQVEEINGLSTLDMRTLTFHADEAEIWWQPRCAGAIMSYSLNGEQFAVIDSAYEPPPPPAEGEMPPQPKPVCLIGRPSFLLDATKALRAANSVARDNRNNLLFTGSQTRIVLSRTSDTPEK